MTKSTKTKPGPNNQSITPATTVETPIVETLTEHLAGTPTDDVELKICFHKETIEEQTDKGEYDYSYQPSSLWVTFNDELNMFVMNTPHCKQSIVSQPTSELKDAHTVSEHFYYVLYESMIRVEDEHSPPPDVLNVSDTELPLAERYYLKELLERAFTEPTTPDLFTQLILQKAENHFETTRHSPHQQDPRESRISQN